MEVSAETGAAVRTMVLAPTIVRWFTQPGSPLVLALLRVAAFAMLLYVGWVFDPRSFAELPHELMAVPAGGWLLTSLPIGSGWVTAGWVAMMSSAVLAMIGWRIRWTGLVAVASAFYVLGVPTLFGKVNHYHHLLWIGLLLAVSPCTDAFAVDARGKRLASGAYGFPLRVTWVLLGLVYLGAGLPKISEGLGWALSENLRNQMWVHWWVLDMEPVARFDRWPWLYQSAGLLTLVFEVGFVAAVVWRRTRWLAVAGGLVFHVATRFILGFVFWTLPPMYVAFIPHRGPVEDRPPQRRTVLVGAGLIVAVGLASLFTIQRAWPVATYPAFPRLHTPEAILYTITEPDGTPVTTRDAGLDAPGAWHFLQQRIGTNPALLPVLEDHLDTDLVLVREVVHTNPDSPAARAEVVAD